jgi:copper(I)-binding protein
MPTTRPKQSDIDMRPPSLAAIALAVYGAVALSSPLWAGDGHGHAAHAGAVTVGAIEIATPMIRATTPGQPVAGGFLRLTNAGAEDDRLVAASVPPEVAGRTELHEMAMDGGVMLMRELETGIPLPAGETVTLMPGGLHLMFLELTGALEAGTAQPVTLTFERAGEVTVEMDVLPLPAVRAAFEGEGGGMGHGDGGHGQGAQGADG